MKASVVVPTYNRPHRLRAAIESIVTQSFKDYEVILVDDGSTISEQREQLKEIEDSYKKVKVIRQENSGPAAARNRGWREAKGDVVLFTDDDCLVPSDWVEKLQEGFEPGVAAVGGPFVPAESHFKNSIFAKYHRWEAEDMYRPIEQSRRQQEPLPHGITANIAYRRSILEEFDGFDEGFPVAGGEDADLIRRVSEERHSFKYIPSPVSHNDPYSWETFIKRSYNRGKGLHHLHERHGPSRTSQRVLIGLLASVFFLPKEIVHQRGLRMAGIAVLDRIVSRFGELSESLS